MRDNPLRFAVVREDPGAEARLFARHDVRRALLVASGGCTALTLSGRFPGAAFTLVDPNPAQLSHVRAKVAALAAGGDGPLGPDTLARFNVEDRSRTGLSECGEFESLFRLLRATLHEFVAEPPEIESWLDPDADAPRTPDTPYWSVAFELAFADPLLHAMFGPAATQHAVRGSYPAYFRRRVEAGLTAPDRATNPYLRHVLTGCYSRSALPPFLREPPRAPRFEYECAAVADVPEIGTHDFVGLSNIMDWMSEEECRPMIDRLRTELRKGAVVLWRQLNNGTDRESWFGQEFAFDAALGRTLLAAERSLFYESVHVGVRQ